MSHFDKPKPYTADQIELLYRLGAAQDEDWDDIALQCGHPRESCRTTLNKLLAAIAEAHGVSFGRDDPRHPKRTWSKPERDELVRLRTIEGRSFPDIDRALGRSDGASAQKFRSLRPEPEAAPNGIERRAIHEAKHVPEHTSLAAAHLGDPLPGRSALDRRRAGFAEPAPYLGRAVRYPMQVSLATEPAR